MHARRIQWSGVAAVFLFAATAWAEKPAVAPAEPAPLDAPAAEADLIVGDGYTMEVKRGDVAESCRGDLVKATDKWVVLRNSDVSMQCEGIPFLMDLPLVGELFCRYSDVVEVTDLWIPREAATLRSHTPGAKVAAANPVVANEPPTAAMCRVSAAASGKLDHFIRPLSAVDGDDVTLAGNDDKYRLRIARRDILSIEIPLVHHGVAAELVGEEEGE